MSVIQIVPVTSNSQKRIFVALTWSIYNSKDHPAWVPPLRITVTEALDTKKNPFYRNADIQLFLAYRAGIPVGRIAAIENRSHNMFHNDKTGFYGFFECVDDQSVANALFEAAAGWLRSRGLKTMQGPMNPSTNHECGLLVSGYDKHPTLMTTWNPEYYTALHEKASLKGVKDLVAYILFPDQISSLSPRIAKYAERIQKKSGIVFRDFDVKNFERDVEICFDIYNSAWEKNWGFFPMSREEFFFAAKDMKMLVNPNFAFIAERDGKPAGFMLALPDFNQVFKRIPDGRLFPTGIFKLLAGKRSIDAVRIITLGVKPEFRGGGIFALFTYESFRRAKEAKIKYGEASWILEDNEPMNKPWIDIGAPQYRKWRIYEKEL